MNQQLQQEYTVRIASANRSELVVIVYEIILEDLRSAERALEKGEKKQFTNDLQHAQKFLMELMNTLNYRYSLSLDLMQLYLFVNKQMIMAKLKKDIAYLEIAVKIMDTLLYGFKEAAKQDKSSPVMINAQQVYAGLTYGKGTLNETYLDPLEQTRGFRV